ncbi:alpha/beta fold hydrolase [Mycolicibacterium hippocampi]|uniref:Epoxide hydrolase EphF n=1 Tax=Mycolicibacterium hippocampi TaxID=659824 RepID=A0A7I9ZVB2_9MYCO|nr:alpha/beta hydrolase [Mycolicibacterium hippocampi]GFH04884.1 epoxide hydrolase EphF [Mycolicibacterium hippocampi]
MTNQPPPIGEVRRSFVTARGVRFHVTEAGPPDGRPVLALHGWPQHHWVYRDLLADPPPGMRIIAPDLPGYGWSGPAPHRWAKEDVVSDLIALLDALGLERVLLVGHDWGGFLGHLLVLRVPERIEGYLALNIAHPWVPPKVMARHAWRFLLYQPLIAAAGIRVQTRTRFLDRVYAKASEIDPQTARVYTDRFRDPVVARTARDTYRTFLVREIPRMTRSGERRRATVPIRVLFGKNDTAIAPALAAVETARADDYTLETVDAGHFIADERPELVRAKLIALAAEVPAS